MNRYFTIEELIYSDTANKLKIDNTPDFKVINNLIELIDFLNPLREAWGKPIRVNSGYRCSELNSKLGGSITSVHKIGYAADLYSEPYNEFKEFIIEYLKDKKFDQCIVEKSGNTEWIHIGLYNNFKEQRKQIFNIDK